MSRVGSGRERPEAGGRHDRGGVAPELLAPASAVSGSYPAVGVLSHQTQAEGRPKRPFQTLKDLSDRPVSLDLRICVGRHWMAANHIIHVVSFAELNNVPAAGRQIFTQNDLDEENGDDLNF